MRCRRTASVSGTMADQLKKQYSEEGKLTELAVETDLCEEKKETGKVMLPGKVKQFFPKGYSNQQIEQVILNCLRTGKTASKKWEGGKKMANTMLNLIISMVMSRSSLLFRIPSIVHR